MVPTIRQVTVLATWRFIEESLNKIKSKIIIRLRHSQSQNNLNRSRRFIFINRAHPYSKLGEKVRFVF